MGSQLNPYISYDGNARQAMEFYREVFGGLLEMGTVSDFGSPDSPNADKLMHARLDTPDGYTLMAWDVPEGAPTTRATMSRCTSAATAASSAATSKKLSAGGIVTMPLEKQAWGDEAGELVDPFGIGWMSNITRRQT